MVRRSERRESFVAKELVDGRDFRQYLSLVIPVWLTFYACEWVWRERQVKLDQVVDTSPVSIAVLMLGKVSAMLLLLLAFATTAMLASMFVQVLKGYPAINLPVYLLYVYLQH